MFYATWQWLSPRLSASGQTLRGLSVRWALGAGRWALAGRGVGRGTALTSRPGDASPRRPIQNCHRGHENAMGGIRFAHEQLTQCAAARAHPKSRWDGPHGSQNPLPVAVLQASHLLPIVIEEGARTRPPRCRRCSAFCSQREQRVRWWPRRRGWRRAWRWLASSRLPLPDTCTS